MLSFCVNVFSFRFFSSPYLFYYVCLSVCLSVCLFFLFSFFCFCFVLGGLSLSLPFSLFFFFFFFFFFPSLLCSLFLSFSFCLSIFVSLGQYCSAHFHVHGPTVNEVITEQTSRRKRCMPHDSHQHNKRN